MARMFPELSDANLERVPSRAEAKVYRALRDRTNADYEVHYSVAWIMRDPHKAAQDGEGESRGEQTSDPHRFPLTACATRRGCRRG